MSIVYLNGEYLPASEAKISVFDRGFLFGDGLYEVIPYYNGHALGLKNHLERLRNGLAETKISFPTTDDELIAIMNTVQDKNAAQDRAMYVQITRGTETTRQHMPGDTIQATLLVMPLAISAGHQQHHVPKLKVITAEDIRWQSCHIKAITLLPNIIYCLKAKEHEANEVLLFREGLATEGATSNLFIIEDGNIITPKENHLILGGVTRHLLKQLATDNNIGFYEEDISHDRLNNATEVWLASSTKEVCPVTHIDGKPVGNGEPGPLWHSIYQLYQTYKNSCGEN